MNATLSTLSGQPVTREVLADALARGAPRLAVVAAPVAPLRAGDILEVEARASADPGALVLFERDARCELARVARRAGAHWLLHQDHPRRRLLVDHLLAVVSRIEAGDVALDLTCRAWRTISRIASRVPPAAPLLRLLILIERARHPLFPALDLGGEAALVEGVRQAYALESRCWTDLEGLRPEEEIALARHLRSGMRLLDVGCGGGREAIAFARAGLDVLAIDFVPSMIEAARAKAEQLGLRIGFELADVRTFRSTPGAWDAIHLSSSVYAHVPGRARRVALLRALAAFLRPGGLLMVAVGPAPRLSRLSRARLVDVLRRLGARWRSDRMSEPGDHWTRVFALDGRRSRRYLHRFADAVEIEAELTESGLMMRDRIDDQLWVLSRSA